MTTNGSAFEHSVRVYQAQGMVAAQASCSMDAALALMQNTAEASEVTLEHVRRFQALNVGAADRFHVRETGLQITNFLRGQDSLDAATSADFDTFRPRRLGVFTAER